MNKKINVMLVVLVMCLSGWVSAEDWTNGGGNQEWSDPNNWNPNYLPYPGAYLQINVNEPDMPIYDAADGAKSYAQIAIADVGVGFMKITGGDLDLLSGDAWWDMQIGYFAGGNGTLYIEGGNIVCDKRIALGGRETSEGGVGRIIMTGGSLKTRWIWQEGLSILNDASYIDLSGGILEVEALTFKTGVTGYVKVTGSGKLILRNQTTTTDVDALIASGNIIGDFTVSTQGYAIIIEGPNPVCGNWGYPALDFNKDCIVNFSDFAVFAAEWLVCTDPALPGCVNLFTF